VKKGLPRPLDDTATETLVERINSEHRLDLKLAGAFHGGEGPGAYRLEGPEGPVVLKVLDGEMAERLPQVSRAVDELRERGYLAPHYLHIGSINGVTYALQEFVPGQPIFDVYRPAHIPRLLELNDMQSKFTVELPNQWPDLIVTAVLHGAEGFFLHETMREHSDEASRLLDELIELTSRNVDGIDERRDLVHLDFTGANVLAIDDEITGVIDLEAVRVGDRAFDLVSFQYYLFENEALRSPLFTKALELSGPAAVKVYFAHMIFRQTQWSMRFHDAKTVRDVLDRSRFVLDTLDEKL